VLCEFVYWAKNTIYPVKDYVHVTGRSSLKTNFKSFGMIDNLIYLVNCTKCARESSSVLVDDEGKLER